MNVVAAVAAGVVVVTASENDVVRRKSIKVGRVGA